MVAADSLGQFPQDIQNSKGNNIEVSKQKSQVGEYFIEGSPYDDTSYTRLIGTLQNFAGILAPAIYVYEQGKNIFQTLSPKNEIKPYDPEESKRNQVRAAREYGIFIGIVKVAANIMERTGLDKRILNEEQSTLKTNSI